MRNLIRTLTYLALAISVIASCKERNRSTGDPSYGEATKELIAMMNNDSHLKSLLVSSIQKAKEINPDTVYNPARSLEQYFVFVSKIERSMPWTYVTNENNRRT